MLYLWLKQNWNLWRWDAPDLQNNDRSITSLVYACQHCAVIEGQLKPFLEVVAAYFDIHFEIKYPTVWSIGAKLIVQSKGCISDVNNHYMESVTAKTHQGEDIKYLSSIS